MIAINKCIYLAHLVVLSLVLRESQSAKNLKTVHVVFAHQLVAPLEQYEETSRLRIPKDMSYSYFDQAASQMGNKVKMDMFQLGGYLRKNYDNFLGSLYYPEATIMRTTEYQISMISGYLVNAGLWPPSAEQKFIDNLDWQPIPTVYVSKPWDTLLLGTECPNYLIEFEKVVNSAESKELLGIYQELFDYVYDSTGLKVFTITDFALLYSILKTTEGFNITLPKWAQKIYPEGYGEVMKLAEYERLSKTPIQKRLNGGTMLKHVIQQSEEMQRDNATTTKMYLYSGDDRNVVGLLYAMNTWSPHVPNDASAVIFEVYHDDANNQTTLKFFYYTGTENQLITLNLQPNCTVNCDDFTLTQFKKFVNDNLPDNETELCGFHVNKFGSDSNGNAASTVTNSIILISVISVSLHLFA